MGIKTWRLAVAVAAAAAVVVAFFFLDDPSLRAKILAWQFTPALITHAGAALVVVILAAISTAIWGRAYCSLLCPAGVIQELAFRLGKRLGLARTGFVPPPRLPWIPLAAAILLFAGLTQLAGFLDPLGWFGRLVAPFSELATGWREGSDRHAAYLGAAGFSVLLAGAVLIVVPLFRGRWFCDRVCPVGATLGAVAALSLKRVVLDPESCRSCRRCAKVCPVRCIDVEGRRVDQARCVLCFSCLPECSQKAIAYRAAGASGRREALAKGAALAGGAAYLAARGWHGPASGADAVLPPGAGSASSYYRACVGCNSCVAACPTGIIKPRFPWTQPELRFDLGYCLYGCELCTRSCPSGALRPLSPEDKRVTRIATTEFSFLRCVVSADGTACGACAEVCPTHALTMEPWEDGKPTRPVLHPDHCIGCGACMHVCPTRPPSFTIRGLARHETALPMRQSPAPAESESSTGDGLGEFPF